MEWTEIYSVQSTFEPTEESFWGACIDSGARKTVIGQPQTKAYAEKVGREADIVQLKQSDNKKFRFGNADHKCIAFLHIRMSVSDDIVVTFDAYVVSIDVFLLLGLDVLCQLELIVKFKDGTLLTKYNDWHAKVVHKMGHLYVEWPPSVYYTETELRRIHRHFFHPSTEKLMGLIRHGAKEYVTPHLRGQLDQVRNSCDTCQRLAPNPNRFKVSMPQDCVFNRAVGMDVMKIHKQSVLHVVNRDTKLAAATFLDGESSEKVWEAFLSCWVATYIGYPDAVVLD